MSETTRPILLKNVHLLSEAADLRVHLYLRNGKIADIRAADASQDDAFAPDAAVFDLQTRYPEHPVFAVPGFVDLHTHLRDPGFTYKEDIFTGCAAAAAGGFTTIVAMPNTEPPADNPDTIAYVLEKARAQTLCRVLPAGTITKNRAGEEISDYAALAAAGAAAFSDDGSPVENVSVMRQAMHALAAGGHLMLSHSEETELSRGGVIHDGEISRMLSVTGIPASSEDVAIARDLLLAAECGCRLHIAHVSTATSVQLIREAKARGIAVSAETCPHYFSLTDTDVPRLAGNGKMKPPLRTEADVLAIREGLRDGTLDCISTDHAPHAAHEKNGSLADAAFGIIGLESAFAVSCTYLVKSGVLSLSELIARMSRNPANILGLTEIGSRAIAKDEIADITLIAPDADATPHRSERKSKSDNSPFWEHPLTGKILGTICAGNLHWNE